MILQRVGALVLAAMAPVAQAQTLHCADLSGEAPVPNVRFDEDVLPILEDDLLQCTNCHGSAANLSLDQGASGHDDLLCVDTEGSVPQPAGKRIVPGAPMESWFYLRVACDDPDDPDFRMPRNEYVLTTGELRIIHDWIAQGAPSATTVFASRFDDRGYCP